MYICLCAIGPGLIVAQISPKTTKMTLTFPTGAIGRSWACGAQLGAKVFYLVTCHADASCRRPKNSLGSRPCPYHRPVVQ
ncbi:hypothetical protein BDZ88DRAFT_186032 [Geranomyces variabilis]|nr:hypothetical protein BDZ88DRAFT_186032 [Geranomyces variabilis]